MPDLGSINQKILVAQAANVFIIQDFLLQL
jgi:hypothetical protein